MNEYDLYTLFLQIPIIVKSMPLDLAGVLFGSLVSWVVPLQVPNQRSDLGTFGKN